MANSKGLHRLKIVDWIVDRTGLKALAETGLPDERPLNLHGYAGAEMLRPKNTASVTSEKKEGE